jgi:outer membrane lipoprotein SlyB
MKNSAKPEIKKDLIGVFFDAHKLEDAISDLHKIGVTEDHLGILCAEESLTGKLGHIYNRVSAQTGENDPDTVFVQRESIGSTPYAAIGGLSFVASAIGGGAIVASAGIFGGALAAATAGPVVVGLAGLLAGTLMSKTDSESLQEQVDSGHILLFVRTGENRFKDEVSKLLEKHSAVKITELDAE